MIAGDDIADVGTARDDTAGVIAAGDTSAGQVKADARRSCIEVAAEFVAAQPGGITRILTAHQPRPDGTCAGCLHKPTSWPCTTATIAHRAQHLT